MISNFFVLSSVKAIAAPTVSFMGGDDILQDGGVNDAYDSYIKFSIETTPTGGGYAFENFEIQYSNDGGDNWYNVYNVTADYDLINLYSRVYHWSTTNIFAPTLLFRARGVFAGDHYSEYLTETLNLSHREDNPLANYHLEDFSTADNILTYSNMSWDNQGYIKLASGQTTGYLTSKNVLSAVNNNHITQIAFQPVQENVVGADLNVQYRFSNNGNDWVGPYSFKGQIVPAAQVVEFATSGDELYWRISMTDESDSNNPYVFQLRIDWVENYIPQACFIPIPVNSENTEESFVFNGLCTSDYEDTLNQLDYRWDFDNDGSYEINWTAGAYTQTHNYHSTSTQTVRLEVRDTYDEVDSYTTEINTGQEPVGVYGWLWSSNYGWTSLNCENIYYGSWETQCNHNYGLTRNGNQISGWAWDPHIGWLCFGSTCDSYYSESPPYGDINVTYDSETGEVQGWGNYLVFGGTNGWLSLNDQDGSYQVTLDSTGSLTGYAWNNFSGDRGVGWVQFLGSLNFPWLETKYGSIYGIGNVGSTGLFNAPSARYNATYCIRTAGTIVNFSSESGCTDINYTNLDFPSLSNQYWTIAGLIDFNRLVNDYEQVNFASSDVDASLKPTYITLDNKVYNFTGQLAYTIDSPITFYNARGNNSSGAGTIIIDGDLNIDSDMYYEEAVVASQIENLASITWIVKGNVYIDPSVSHLVGNFIVLGDGSDTGKFYTGDDTGIERQLVIRGLVMTGQFFLERTYMSGNEPAEQIIYDGRVLVNTPPGMDNVAQGLPIWREAMASTEIE